MDDEEGDQLVDQYSGENFELVIVLIETADRQVADQQDCEELQGTQKGTVLLDPDYALRDTYDMQINMGSGLLNNDGKWESDPTTGFDSWPDAQTALANLVGGGF